MPQPSGVFLCDLSVSQQETAEKWSVEKGAKSRNGKIVRLFLSGSKPNLEWYSESSFEDSDQQEIDSLTADLLAIASFFYQADRMLKRPEEQTREWYRELEFHIGVVHLDKWKSQATELAAGLKLLTRDTFRLRFYSLEELRPPLRLPRHIPPVEAICILSTSFIPVFGAASQRKEGDLLASVRYGPDNTRASQENLIKEISTISGGFGHVAFWLKPSHLKVKERTQGTLGFFEFALAAAVARRTELASIQVFDDVVSSYHLRPRRLCGPGYALRSTRPDFLWTILNVLKSIDFVKDVTIRNPFQFSTSSEVLSGLPVAKPDAEALLRRTDNCLEKKSAMSLRSKWGDLIPHCGICFPCKLRRLSALAAGLEVPGDFSAYALNPLVPTTPNQKISDNLKRRIEDFHVKGIPEFKRFLRGFATRSTQPLSHVIRTELLSVSSEKFFFDSSAPSAGEISHAVICQWIIDAHNRFWDQVEKFLP